ncbi:glycosyltransferase domain-containing protein [Algoriphagus marinus]|uniref:glycosyltransferase domain-containing protein n=1 Tax=Algoriphagus marinus TaxID=1925762 RepID=UPI000A960F1C|nr:glycosyltransferase domain-containing protein [Algoriphagus marinus]
MKINRLAVYTALFGDYDQLSDPNGNFEGVDFICFTDQESLVSKVWDIRLVFAENRSSLELNRMYKILPHLYLQQYEMSIYIDSNIVIKEKASKLFLQLTESKYKFVLSKHFERNCIYQEAQIIIKSKKEKANTVNLQMKGYQEEGFPKEFGLTENGLLFRRHLDPQIIESMELWWREFSNKSKRDQLSLMYVLWKLNVDYNTNIFSIRRSPYFSIALHKRFDTKFNRMIGYVKFKRFYDSNQPLPPFFDFVDRVYGKLANTN